MIIPGDDEERAITPAVWQAFEWWHGDKSYREAQFVEGLEQKLREHIAAELLAAARRADPHGQRPEAGTLTYDDAASIARGAAGD